MTTGQPQPGIRAIVTLDANEYPCIVRLLDDTRAYVEISRLDTSVWTPVGNVRLPVDSSQFVDAGQHDSCLRGRAE